MSWLPESDALVMRSTLPETDASFDAVRAVDANGDDEFELVEEYAAFERVQFAGAVARGLKAGSERVLVTAPYGKAFSLERVDASTGAIIQTLAVGTIVSSELSASVATATTLVEGWSVRLDVAGQGTAEPVLVAAAAPEIWRVEPRSIMRNTGQIVRIEGAGFAATPTVKIGGSLATVVSSTSSCIVVESPTLTDEGLALVEIEWVVGPNCNDVVVVLDTP